MKRMVSLAGALGLFLWGGLCAEAASQEKPPALETEKVVVTATLTEKSLEEAPGSFQVITAEEIAETGAVTVAEVLEWAVGLVVASDTGRADVPSIRGTGNKHTLVMIDGRRLALGYKDFIDTDQIPVAMIKRIEVLRGPNSALYGSDAIGGVVNIVTRKTPHKTVAGVTGRYGSHFDGDGEAWLTSAYGGMRAGGFGFLLSAGFKNQQAWDEDGALPDDGDRKRLGSAAGRFSLDLTPNQSLETGFEYSEAEREGLRLYQNLERQREAEDKRLNYYLQYDADIPGARHLMARVYRSQHENDIDFSPYTEVTAEEDAEHWLNQAETRFSTPLGDKHILSLGGEFRSEGREDSTGRKDDLENASLFAQDEYQIVDPLYLVLGLRYDDHSEFGSQFTPRAALIWRLHDHLRIKGAYGKGFRAPSVSELFVTSYRQKGKWIYQPNPDLQPEESQSYEAGIEGEAGPLRAGVNLFENRIEDLIETVFIGTTGSGKNAKQYYTYKNISEATIRGVEIESILQLPLNLTLSADLTWLDTENKQTGEELEGRPDYKAGLKLGYRDPEAGIRANVRVNHHGEQYYAAGSQSAYTICSCYFSKQMNGQISVFCGIDNIFNEEEVQDGITYIEPALYYAGFEIAY